MIRIVRSIISAVTEGVIKRFSGTGLKDQSFANREYFQHYGFTSRPLPGAEGIVQVQGNVVYLIASDDRRYRIALENGEVALYTDEGDFIHFKRGKEIHITTGNKLVIDAANDVEIMTKRLKAEASESAEVKSPIINLKADAITMDTYSGATPQGTFKGNFRIEGDVDITGRLDVDGNIDSAGTITDAGGNTNHHSHP